MFAKIGGGFGIFCDLYMGMDTQGIRTGDFFKGVYFERHPPGPRTAPRKSRLGVTMEFKAGAKLSIPFAKAGIEGGIQAQITDWNDPDDNGKVHFDELAENFSHGLQCVARPGRQTRRLHRRTLNIEIRWASPALRSSTSASTSSAPYLRLQLHLPAAPGTGARDE